MNKFEIQSLVCFCSTSIWLFSLVGMGDKAAWLGLKRRVWDDSLVDYHRGCSTKTRLDGCDGMLEWTEDGMMLSQW